MNKKKKTNGHRKVLMFNSLHLMEYNEIVKREIYEWRLEVFNFFLNQPITESSFSLCFFTHRGFQ